MDINNPTPTPGANDITNHTDGLTFSEESRAYLTEHGMSSEKAIIDALKSAEQYKGVDLSKMITVPGEGAKPEEVMAVFDKLGRPAKPEDYGISVPQGENPEFINSMLPVLHNAGLTKVQANKLVEGWNGHLAQVVQKANEQYAKEMAELKAEWGAQYDANIAEAKRAANELAIPKEDLEKLERNVTGSKGLWKMFYNIAKKTGDHTIKGGTPASSSSVNLTDPKQAADKLKELMSDKSFADKIMKDDKEAVKLFNDLQAARFGDRNNG